MDERDTHERYRIADADILFEDVWAEADEPACPECGADLAGVLAHCRQCGARVDVCSGSCSSCGARVCVGDRGKPSRE